MQQGSRQSRLAATSTPERRAESATTKQGSQGESSVSSARITWEIDHRGQQLEIELRPEIMVPAHHQRWSGNLRDHDPLAVREGISHWA